MEEFVSRPEHFRVSVGDWISAIYLASEDAHVLPSGGNHDASGNRRGDGIVPFCASHDHVELGSLPARVWF
jgi:hypothetical protein